MCAIFINMFPCLDMDPKALATLDIILQTSSRNGVPLAHLQELKCQVRF